MGSGVGGCFICVPRQLLVAVLRSSVTTSVPCLGYALRAGLACSVVSEKCLGYALRAIAGMISHTHQHGLCAFWPLAEAVSPLAWCFVQQGVSLGGPPSAQSAATAGLVHSNEGSRLSGLPRCGQRNAALRHAWVLITHCE